MKRILFIFFQAAASFNIYACPACEQQQPWPLRGVIHSAGPGNIWEFGFLLIALLIFGATLFYSVKWLIRPEETSNLHIKYFILDAHDRQ